MGFENATNMISAKNYLENRTIKEIGKKEKSLNERIQTAIKKLPNILQSPTITNTAKDIMLRQGLSSNDIKKMAEVNEESEELEKICDSNDPAVIIALMQYYEVNRKELKLN